MWFRSRYQPSALLNGCRLINFWYPVCYGQLFAFVFYEIQAEFINFNKLFFSFFSRNPFSTNSSNSNAASSSFSTRPPAYRFSETLPQRADPSSSARSVATVPARSETTSRDSSSNYSQRVSTVSSNGSNSAARSVPTQRSDKSSLEAGGVDASNAVNDGQFDDDFEFPMGDDIDGEYVSLCDS